MVDENGKLKKPDQARFLRAKQASSRRKKTRVLGRVTLREVWSDMDKTILPTWCTASPTKIGDGNHGKISADGWRIFCSVHLVVTLGRLWGSLPSEDRKYKLFANFCALVQSTKIANKRSITVADAQEFQTIMIAYLQGVNALFPTYTLVPSHHIVLHMKELLCRLGPTHAWRCWVFERYNHIFQKIPTNGNFGMSYRAIPQLLVPESASLTIDTRQARNHTFWAPLYEPETKRCYLCPSSR
jgi:hypothetical protein